jgi:NAD+ synthase (glutamine-hydrolysing)
VAVKKLLIALAQIETAVGDFEGNSRKILEYVGRAEDAGAEIVLFPELCLTGYPPEDLLLKPEFLDRSMDAIAGIAREVGEIIAIIGFAEGDYDVFNAAAVVTRGEIVCTYRKTLLPNYGVFDERRYFGAGDQGVVLDIGGIRAGITICEDIWFPVGPVEELVSRGGVELILNLSASPFNRGKYERRRRLVMSRSIDGPVVLAYVNNVGAQDELVFDGGSCVHHPRLGFIASAARFKEELLLCPVETAGLRSRRALEPLFRHGGSVRNGDAIRVCRLGRPDRKTSGRRPATGTEVGPMTCNEEIFEALVIGLREYVRKNGFEKVVIGISGGIDSALTAALAVEALGSENVIGVTLPSKYTSDESNAGAAALAGNLGIRLLDVPIGAIYDSYRETLTPEIGASEKGETFENIQARIRGNVLMALSNRFGWLVLATGNKSELSMGYCTLYGDMAGGFALIKDMLKTQVYELARYINERYSEQRIPVAIIERAPTAELRENQLDADSLPPYDRLDPVLELYIEEGLSLQQIVAKGHDAVLVKRVIEAVDANEYKRRQAPVGIKITARAFGRDWRMPISRIER